MSNEEWRMIEKKKKIEFTRNERYIYIIWIEGSTFWKNNKTYVNDVAGDEDEEGCSVELDGLW